MTVHEIELRSELIKVVVVVFLIYMCVFLHIYICNRNTFWVFLLLFYFLMVWSRTGDYLYYLQLDQKKGILKEAGISSCFHRAFQINFADFRY